MRNLVNPDRFDLIEIRAREASRLAEQRAREDRILAEQRAQEARRAEIEAKRVKATPPVITSERGPRYVDRATCPMCGVDRLGVEYHGELMSGAKVHELQAHSAKHRLVVRGGSRCLGAKMRLVFEGGVWKGATS